MTGRRSDLVLAAALAARLRVDCVRCTTRAGSGHPTSGLSAADLLATLAAGHLKYAWHEPGHPGNDRFLLSKGHASSLFYALLHAVAAISDEELLSYRAHGSPLQGHPTPQLPWVEVATGSLGQGLPIAVGAALAEQALRHSGSRTWVLCGDGELAEGSMWEALDKAGHYGLVNLTVIVDVNRLGQCGPTALGWDLAAYERRIAAFGCNPVVVDGHDIAQIDAAFAATQHAVDAPTVVLAQTVKGKGVPQIEDDPSWHGKALPPELADHAIATWRSSSDWLDDEVFRSRLQARLQAPAPAPVAPPSAALVPIKQVTWAIGDRVAVRDAVGQQLAELAADPRVVSLDADVGIATRAAAFARAAPDRTFEMFIAEQQMVATAVGFWLAGYRPFLATFAAFFTRAHDFLRMAALSGSELKLIGTHVGVEIGQDGSSQMGLEDLAFMRALHGSTVFYPSDATSAAWLTRALPDLPGVSYLRATRGAYPVLYEAAATFPIGGCKVPLRHRRPQTALLGAGVTVHECLRAATELTAQGVAAQVIDLYSVKPIDATAVASAVGEARCLVIAEDHYPGGGIAEAVLYAAAEQGIRLPPVIPLSVRAAPGSGQPSENLRAAGIDAESIAAAALSGLGQHGMRTD